MHATGSGSCAVSASQEVLLFSAVLELGMLSPQKTTPSHTLETPYYRLFLARYMMVISRACRFPDVDRRTLKFLLVSISLRGSVAEGWS